MKSKISPLAWCLFLAGFSQFVLANEFIIAETSQILTVNATPNILLIPDTSETMQEEAEQGRIALDWRDTQCVPGTTMPAKCVAGAKSPNSKASIVKRVGLNLVDNFSGRVNMGLLSYQQYPPSKNRADTFSSTAPRTTLWFLTHRPIDVRFARTESPPFFKPAHKESWDSLNKRFGEKHPTLPDTWYFYNVAVPGYYRSTSEGTTHPPQNDINAWDYLFVNQGCTLTQCSSYRKFSSMHTSTPSRTDRFQDPDSKLWFSNVVGDFSSSFTDSMRARGITRWGNIVGFLSTNQLEWRANASPGAGYLHIPIGGINAQGKPIPSHWDSIRKKLAPQRTDWNGTDTSIFTNPDWPLISAGLTPLEGTMYTARDYFLGKKTTYFDKDQGNNGKLPAIPESCGNNAAIWITDGLPSVAANGTALGTNPAAAMLQARNAVKDFYDKTAAEAKLRGPVKTYIVGFALPPGVKQLFENESWFPASGNVLDVLAAAGGTGQAYNATDEAELLRALEAIFQNIIRDSISSSGLASTATELSTDTKIFQSELNTINWSGDLLALSLASGGRDRSQPVWRAATKLAELGHNKRKIFSFYDGQGFEFRTGFTPSAVKNLFKSTSQPESVANNLINYIRGERTNEGSGSDKLRERSNIMGHIVNSTPLFVPGEGTRPPVVYVMANDGMLHAFHANTGTELFAYLPGAILNKLPQYASATYKGEFLLDGQLAYKKVNNTLYLTGTAGTGTQAVFTLDISNPTNFGTGNIVWEVSGSNAFGGLLGRTGSQPIMATLGGKDVVLMGNGYNSAAGKSSLLAVNLQTGALEKAFTVEGSGFGSPGVLDLNRDKNPDFIYIGDFNGKVWRFALNESLATANGYSVSRHLFTSDNNRPIVVAPVAASHPDGGVMVIVGSGELITQNSRTSNVAEYVYGIYDKFDGGTEATITSSQLVSQTLTSSGQNRTASRNPVTPDKAGWRLTLPAGERMLANAVVRRQKVIFGSYKPDNTACSGGGQGYMTELALFSGTPVSLTEPASKPVAGIPRTPIFIEIPEGGFPIVTPGCTDDCDIIADNKELLLIGEQDELHNVIKGRQNWREIGR